jgi:hypothetical protein
VFAFPGEISAALPMRMLDDASDIEDFTWKLSAVQPLVESGGRSAVHVYTYCEGVVSCQSCQVPVLNAPGALARAMIQPFIGTRQLPPPPGQLAELVPIVAERQVHTRFTSARLVAGSAASRTATSEAQIFFFMVGSYGHPPLQLST